MWQPIETAPKDRIIIVHGGIAHWRHTVTGGGWYTLTGEAFPGVLIEWEVTEWMPFPEYSKEAQVVKVR